MLSVLSYIFAFSYLTGNNSFLTPLTPDEEKKALERYEQGDEDAKSALIERNLRLVAHIVKKYSNHNKDLEDLISVGTIGLIKAISTFNSSKGTKLATYAARCIDNAIYNWMTQLLPTTSLLRFYEKIITLVCVPNRARSVRTAA